MFLFWESNIGKYRLVDRHKWKNANGLWGQGFTGRDEDSLKGKRKTGKGCMEAKKYIYSLLPTSKQYSATSWEAGPWQTLWLLGQVFITRVPLLLPLPQLLLLSVNWYGLEYLLVSLGQLPWQCVLPTSCPPTAF